MSSLTRMLLRILMEMRGQLIAVALVVACGVASLVGMRSVYISLIAAQADYYLQYRFSDVFLSIKSAPESMANRALEIAGVRDVETRLMFDVSLDVPGLAEPATGRLVSLPDRGEPRMNLLHLQQGSYPDPDRPDEVVVSSAFAEANQLQPGDRFGAVLNGRWRELVIRGVAISPEFVYEIQGGAAILPDNLRFGIIWMRRKAIAAAFNREGAFNNLVIDLARDAKQADAIAALDQLFETYGALGAYGRDDQVAYRFLTDEISQLRGSSTYMPAVFFGVAAFLLNMVLSRLLTLQRKQVALLKAFGYTNLTVGLLYLRLALIVVAVGYLIGILVGIWFGMNLTEIYQVYYRFPSLPFRLDMRILGIAAGVSAIAAALGAIEAVRRAAALPPAEAMRPEPPAAFHHHWTERLRLFHILPPVGRMILRSLARRPVKALLSITGIASAVAILVLGRWGLDAMELIVEMQYELVQKEDVAVSLESPRAISALHSFERLPGVLAAEPFRMVAVRLRNGHRAYKVGLLGIERNSRFRYLVDRDRNITNLPPEGLVLTAKLAEILHLARGDRVRIEVLEGNRATREAVVVGLVDEMLGLSAYMSLEAVNRLMRETQALSGAYLQVDKNQSAQLYQRLKQIPSVSGVAVEEAMVESFEKVIAESMSISLNTLIVFACIIAFGVVYNGVRIALSERSTELASLRVLGFTKREVGWILLGEQAILTLAAIPVGFLIGGSLAALLSKAMSSEMYRMPLVQCFTQTDLY